LPDGYFAVAACRPRPSCTPHLTHNIPLAARRTLTNAPAKQRLDTAQVKAFTRQVFACRDRKIAGRFDVDASGGSTTAPKTSKR
jgi:hypothetical protein